MSKIFPGRFTAKFDESFAAEILPVSGRLESARQRIGKAQ
jgi:hypothetical protein